eukprot:7387504-Prymnesium_polylepis.3
MVGFESARARESPRRRPAAIRRRIAYGGAAGRPSRCCSSEKPGRERHGHGREREREVPPATLACSPHHRITPRRPKVQKECRVDFGGAEARA